MSPRYPLTDDQLAAIAELHSIGVPPSMIARAVSVPFAAIMSRRAFRDGSSDRPQRQREARLVRIRANIAAYPSSPLLSLKPPSTSHGR